VVMRAPWVRTGLSPKLGPFPGWVFLPAPFTIFNLSQWWGWVPLVVTMVLALWLHKKGRTLIWVWRRFQAKLRGNKVVARSIGWRRVQNTEQPLWHFDMDTWRNSK